MRDLLLNQLGKEKAVLLLGFGREGKSSFRWFTENMPQLSLAIADKNEAILRDPMIGNRKDISFFLGDDYLKSMDAYQIIFKSPGIFLPDALTKGKTLLTQTDLFLQRYYDQVIGITGTKGKSTTSSLIAHFLKYAGQKPILLGNIGIPAFDELPNIKENTPVVFELSAHQLRDVHTSPHVGVLLNIFPEHLDFFKDFAHYKEAKLHLFNYQKPGDIAINGFLKHTNDFSDAVLQKIADTLLREDIDIASIKMKSTLLGNHNIFNTIMAMAAVYNRGVSIDQCLESLPFFQPLPHRMELLGTYKGITFYNDSISTVPESTMAAVRSLPDTDVLLLGGFDRGLDYSELTDFLIASSVSYFLFMGRAGEKMYRKMQKSAGGKTLILVKDLQEAIETMGTLKNIATCLLSPAAASYDAFHNFEHRGDTFRQLIKAFYSA